MEHDHLAEPFAASRPVLPRPAPKIGVFERDPRIERDRHNKTARAVAAGPEFTGICGKHGAALFDTETGACLPCLADLHGQGLPPLVVYRAAGASLYPNACPEHGEAALHLVQNGLCVACHAEQRGDPVRIRARREGRKTYDAYCGTCGDTTEFHVSSGTCSSCTNSVGRGRKADPVAQNPVRVAARKAGSTTYLGDCAIHGETAFNTVRGKCLQCFNSLGQPRKRQA